MNERMKLWLDGELRGYEATMQEFRKNVNKTAYISMIVCIVGIMLLGVISAISSGQSIISIFYIHLPAGCIFALFVWFCFWCQSKSASMKKARTVYERDFAEYFCSEEEQEAFLAQMEINDYGRISFMDIKNTLYDKYPTQFVAGPDYLMLLSGSGCKFIRTADIESVRIRGEWTRASCRAGSFNGFQRAMVGISLAFDYKEEACVRLGLKKDDYMAIFLHHESQVNEIVALIKKHCPASAEFMGTI